MFQRGLWQSGPYKPTNDFEKLTVLQPWIRRVVLKPAYFFLSSSRAEKERTRGWEWWKAGPSEGKGQMMALVLCKKRLAGPAWASHYHWTRNFLWLRLSLSCACGSLFWSQVDPTLWWQWVALSGLKWVPLLALLFNASNVSHPLYRDRATVIGQQPKTIEKLSGNMF